MLTSMPSAMPSLEDDTAFAGRRAVHPVAHHADTSPHYLKHDRHSRLSAACAAPARPRTASAARLGPNPCGTAGTKLKKEEYMQ